MIIKLQPGVTAHLCDHYRLYKPLSILDSRDDTVKAYCTRDNCAHFKTVL